MITNDRQYRIVKSQIENFQESLEMFSLDSEDTKDVHPKILEAEKRAVNYQLQQLLAEVKEYEDLKAGNIIITEVHNLKELPLVLIKSRIANGLTQSDLAQILGMKEQQIQKYEAEQYESVSLRTLLRIAEILKINIQADVQIRELESSNLYDVSKYPFKQMFQRKWFPEFSGSLNEAVKNSSTLIANLYQRAGIENIQQGLTRRSVRSESIFNKDALNVWYARVIIKARDQDLDTFFDKNIVSESWLKQLASFSTDSEGPEKAVQFLKNNGIRVVFESQIEGTYLDGAALLIDKVYPAIALSLRYDRLDNFWFVLFHELAHIVLHIGGEFDTIFDDLDSHIDGMELEADMYALNISIPESIWKKSLVRFSPSNETIVNQARSLKVHPALIAGRIRRETGKYHLFNDLIGQGEVRNKFSNELNN
jgi:HTH-type transcriptional regulator/antitoxin HigA